MLTTQGLFIWLFVSWLISQVLVCLRSLTKIAGRAGQTEQHHLKTLYVYSGGLLWFSYCQLHKPLLRWSFNVPTQARRHATVCLPNSLESRRLLSHTHFLHTVGADSQPVQGRHVLTEARLRKLLQRGVHHGSDKSRKNMLVKQTFNYTGQSS